MLYWTIQVLSWGAFTGALLLSVFYFTPGDPPEKVVHLQITIGLCCLVSSHLYREVIRRNGWENWTLSKLVPTVLLGSLLTAVFAQILIHGAMLTVLDWTAYRPIVWAEFPIYTLNVTGVMLIWSACYFAYHAFTRARRAELEAVRAEAALKEAELIALKAQINPHFLFNALNNIRALILEDPGKSREALTNLSEMLRYSVRFSTREIVPLEMEIDVVKNYLKLESIQYGERLTYALEIQPDTLEKKIPPMVIQLLVENAVKHGISQLQRGGRIRISTLLRQDDLLICVENTGKLKSAEPGGTGIRNALDRIRILFNADPEFQLTENGGTVTATLQLPAAL